jgi:phycoerythrin-associated linker protein
MECDPLVSAESLLRNGDISVKGFVSFVAKSDLYRSPFFESSSPYRFIELNAKHFLGRAPADRGEISARVITYNQQGYDAEIDSYLDSNEYNTNFGENTVPYPRTTSSQVGTKNVGFNRMFALYRGDATSDADNKAKLIADAAANLGTKIKAPVSISGACSNTGKRFRISAIKGSGSRMKASNVTYEVGCSQLSQNIQYINKSGGKILSITEVA